MSLIETQCIACGDPSGKMIRHTINRRAVGANDVHIKISYSGICHSDIHTGKQEWGPKTYPLCVGHEILGKVVAVGTATTKFKIGDVAGVGCFTDSCRNCDECKEGEDQFCSGPGGMHGTYASVRPEELHPGGVTQGGYSSDIVVNENYVIKVPEKMNVPGAAPLLCAGITCYSPFVKHGLKAGQTLGVIGLGGLGHMAVKIGKAMGCNVTVFTTSPGKVETAKALGAAKVIVSTDAEAMKEGAATCHIIYNSVAFKHDVHPYLACLKAQGTMLMIGGIPEGGVPAGTFALIGRGLRMAGSLIGGIRETQEMIDFCAKHDLLSDIELIPAEPEAVDKAWERTIKSDVKFRFVIDTGATLK